MDDLEHIIFLDQIEKLSEFAEIQDDTGPGLTLDSLNFADFWMRVEVPE